MIGDLIYLTYNRGGTKYLWHPSKKINCIKTPDGIGISRLKVGGKGHFILNGVLR